jgi:DNA invertase Pin-like site-specific DNA recombinase
MSLIQWPRRSAGARPARLEAVRAKAKGVNAGKSRPSSIDEAQVRKMKTQGLGATAIAEALGIGRASVDGVLEANSI